MQRSSNRQVVQFNLFQPSSDGIRWEDLPKEIQQQSLQLLVRLLRQQSTRRRGCTRVGEVSDE